MLRVVDWDCSHGASLTRGSAGSVDPNQTSVPRHNARGRYDGIRQELAAPLRVSM
jgi:hypothetical protein